MGLIDDSSFLVRKSIKNDGLWQMGSFGKC